MLPVVADENERNRPWVPGEQFLELAQIVQAAVFSDVELHGLIRTLTPRRFGFLFAGGL